MAALVRRRYTWNITASRAGVPVSGVRIIGYDDPDTLSINQFTNAQGQLATDEVVEAEEISVTGDIATITTQRNPYEIRALNYGDKLISFGKTFVQKSVDSAFLEVDSVITETTKATVLAYPGYFGNAFLTDLGPLFPTGNWDPQKLYDRSQADAIDNPFPGRIASVESLDGVNFVMQTALIFSGITFDGGGASYDGSLNAGADGTPLDVNNITFTGDVFLGDTSQLDFNNFNCNEFDIFGDTPGPSVYNLTDCTIEIVSTDEGQPITVNLLGTSTINTNANPADITVVNAKNITVRCLDFNTQLPIELVRVFLEEEIGGADIIDPATLTDVNGEVTVSYNLLASPTAAVGFARKGSESPTYKAVPITVDITGDTVIILSLIPDGA